MPPSCDSECDVITNGVIISHLDEILRQPIFASQELILASTMRDETINQVTLFHLLPQH